MIRGKEGNLKRPDECVAYSIPVTADPIPNPQTKREANLFQLNILGKKIKAMNIESSERMPDAAGEL